MRGGLSEDSPTDTAEGFEVNVGALGLGVHVHEGVKRRGV